MRRKTLRVGMKRGSGGGGPGKKLKKGSWEDAVLY